MEHEEDPAMVLHLVAVLLFQQHTGCMLHAPGRMVPSIVAILEKYLPEEEQKILLSFQQLIIKYITAVRNREEANESSNDLNSEPKKMVKQVKTQVKQQKMREKIMKKMMKALLQLNRQTMILLHYCPS